MAIIDLHRAHERLKQLQGEQALAKEALEELRHQCWVEEARLAEDSGRRCHFCHGPAHAVWLGMGGLLACCVSCAGNEMQTLFADCVVGSSPDGQVNVPLARLALMQGQAHFWEGISAALAREQRRQRR